MATCIDNSTIYLTPDSPCCHRINSLIRLCNAKNFKSSCKVSPQQCSDEIWLKIREQAEIDTLQEPILAKFYHSTILSHASLESALSYQLATKLSNTNLSIDALHTLFSDALSTHVEIQRDIRNDLKAVQDRDPACLSYLHCLLNFKGFLACQAHRLAHSFWVEGRSAVALMIQSRVSEVFGVDIHPGAKMGSGIVIDHGSGVVIGETAVVGNNVTILHNVTLGGTGKVQGDRHPKIGDGVLIGAGVKILGNVRVGDDAKIGAGSVVLKDVPARATAVGNPARLVGLR